jgi:hypothetical protein
VILSDNAGSYTYYVHELINRYEKEYALGLVEWLSYDCSFEIEGFKEKSQTSDLDSKTQNIISVVENILVRGFPTICSLFVEEEIMKKISRLSKLNFKEKITGGSVEYHLDSSKAEENEFEHLLVGLVSKNCRGRNLDQRNKQVYKKVGLPTYDEIEKVINESPKGMSAFALINIPQSVAKFQKAVLDSIRQGFLDLNDSNWNLVIFERTIPFGVLALVDLFQTIEKIAALAEYEINIPELNLILVKSSVASSFQFENFDSDFVASVQPVAILHKTHHVAHLKRFKSHSLNGVCRTA